MLRVPSRRHEPLSKNQGFPTKNAGFSDIIRGALQGFLAPRATVVLRQLMHRQHLILSNSVPNIIAVNAVTLRLTPKNVQLSCLFNSDPSEICPAHLCNWPLLLHQHWLCCSQDHMMCSSRSTRPLSSCLLSTACRIVPHSQARILCKRDHNHKSIAVLTSTSVTKTQGQ